MTNTFISELPTDQWILERQNYIGGSDIAGILGASSYRTPLQVWMRKKGLIKPEESNPVADFGNIFEPIMADYFENQTGLKTRRVNKPLVHPEHEFLRANIDRRILNGEGVDGTGLLELKTTTSHRLKALAQPYPDEWEYQIQHYLGLTGYNYGFLLIYERDTCRFHKPILIQPDKEFIAENTAKLVRWWQVHMIEGRRPEPINGEDLLLLYPESNSEAEVEASRDSYQLYKELCQVREHAGDLEKREEHLKNQLKKEIGDAERLVLGGRTLASWKSCSQQRLDTGRLREEHPKMYTHYQTETNYRRFTVN